MLGEGHGVGLAVRSRHRGEPTVDPSWEQPEALVGGGPPDERHGGEALEVRGRKQLLADVGSAVGGVGGVIRDRAIVVDEADEAGVLHSRLLGVHGRPQHAL